MLLAVGLAAALRFYRLGEWPPGPYRDEAYNALDALDVLRGQHALFLPANNGREPFYIYPVSYTHLDVYKRQAQRRYCSASAGSVPSFSAWAK